MQKPPAALLVNVDIHRLHTLLLDFHSFLLVAQVHLELRPVAELWCFSFLALILDFSPFLDIGSLFPAVAAPVISDSSGVYSSGKMNWSGFHLA
jgi:hypothetical protein